MIRISREGHYLSSVVNSAMRSHAFRVLTVFRNDHLACLPSCQISRRQSPVLRSTVCWCAHRTTKYCIRIWDKKFENLRKSETKFGWNSRKITDFAERRAFCTETPRFRGNCRGRKILDYVDPRYSMESNLFIVTCLRLSRLRCVKVDVEFRGSN